MVTVTLPLFYILYVYLGCVVIIGGSIVYFKIRYKFDEKFRGEHDNASFKDIILLVLFSPIILGSMIREIFIAIKKFNFKKWRLQKKWYRKWCKGEFYYVVKTDGRQWVKGPIDDMERAYKYEVHTKHKSYYHEFNWPENIF